MDPALDKAPWGARSGYPGPPSGSARWVCTGADSLGSDMTAKLATAHYLEAAAPIRPTSWGNWGPRVTSLPRVSFQEADDKGSQQEPPLWAGASQQTPREG